MNPSPQLVFKRVRSPRGNHRARSGREHGVETLGTVHPAAEAQGEPPGPIENFSVAGQGLAFQVEDTGNETGNQSVVGPVFVPDSGSQVQRQFRCQVQLTGEARPQPVETGLAAQRGESTRGREAIRPGPPEPYRPVGGENRSKSKP